MTRNNITRLLMGIVLAALILSACSPSAPLETRAGDWKATAKFGEFTFTVNPSGTGINRIKWNYSSCSSSIASGGVTISQEAIINPLQPIESNKFSLVLESLSMKFQGEFSRDGTQASGSWTAGECSGNWVAEKSSATATDLPATPTMVLSTPTPISKSDIEAGLSANNFLFSQVDGKYQYCGDSQVQPCPDTVERVAYFYATINSNTDLLLRMCIDATYPYAWPCLGDYSNVLTSILQSLYPQDVVQWVNSQMTDIKSEAKQGKDYGTRQTFVGAYGIDIFHDNLADEVQIQINVNR